MIYTVTLNPAMDKTITLNHLNVNKVNEIQDIRYDVGGKGINVSKMIHSFGENSKVCSIIGGETGKQIKLYLQKESIEHYLVESIRDTRTNIKIVDKGNNTFTDLNENGGPYEEDVYDNLEKYLDQNLTKNDILVLTGSLPKKCNLLIYKTWIEKYNSRGVRVVLDCKGRVLKSCIQTNPYLIKPNQEELEDLCARKLESREDIVEEGRKLVKLGIEHVLISLGDRGAIYVSDDMVLYAKSLNVNVKSTVGAGDAMVAAMCIAIDRQLSVEEGVRLAIASATACIMCPGTSVATIEDVIKLINQVELIKI